MLDFIAVSADPGSNPENSHFTSQLDSDKEEERVEEGSPESSPTTEFRPRAGTLDKSAENEEESSSNRLPTIIKVRNLDYT